MAELIPMEYRIAAAQKRTVRNWGMIAGIAALVAASGLSYAAAWQRQQFLAFDRVNNDYKLKSAVKLEARQLIDRREATARRMARIQDIQDDQYMMALIRNVAREFSENDMLENLMVEVHGKSGDERLPAGSFSVRVNGLTRSDETHAALLDRLSKVGQTSTPAMAVKPGSAIQSDLLAGKAVRFQVTFEQPVKRVADASQGGN